MTIAICFSCGATKFGALTLCEACNVSPRQEDEIVQSLLMTDRHMPMAALEELSQRMMRGEVWPVPDESMMELYRPAAREAQRMLGLK